MPLRNEKQAIVMQAMGRIRRIANCTDVAFDAAVQKRGASLPMFAN